MATKLKTLKQPEIEKLIKQTEKQLNYINTESEPYAIKGYVRTSLEYLIKQLKGDWPI